MSRKKRAIRTGLNDVLWERVAEALSLQRKRLPDLWRALKRNKNTYTSWVNGRTTPQVSDLEELANALKVDAADLLRPVGQPLKLLPRQLELPFEPGGKTAKVQLECTATGVVVRIADREVA